MVYENTALLVGRLLFGGYFALSGLNHFMKSDQLAEWASYKGSPYPELGVYLSGLMILAGGLGVAAGAYPLVSLALIGLFLAVVTPWFHDFWNLEGEEKQDQMTHFLKNTALFGALLILVAVDWTVYALGMGLGIL